MVRLQQQSSLLPLVLAACCLAACGIEIGNPKKPKDQPNTAPSVIIDDPSVAGDVIAAQADEVITAVSEEGEITSSSPLGVHLLDVAPATPAGVIPVSGAAVSSCAIGSAGEAFVAVTSSGNRVNNSPNHGHAANFSGSIEASSTFVWRQPAIVLACNTAKDDVAIDWTKANGMTLDVAVDETESMTINRQGPHGNHSRTSSFQLTGQRHAAWTSAPATVPTSINLTKTITSQVDKTMTAQRRDGTPVSLSTQIVTKTDAPLVVAITRDTASQAWTSKTIVSGVTVTSQGPDWSVLTTYSGVLFTPEGGCVPVSGNISGDIYHDDPTTPTSHFSVAFDGDGDGTITYQDGTQATYVPDQCGLEAAVGS